MFPLRHVFICFYIVDLTSYDLAKRGSKDQFLS